LTSRNGQAFLYRRRYVIRYYFAFGSTRGKVLCIGNRMGLGFRGVILVSVAGKVESNGLGRGKSHA
jgi:hypothetical protein